MKNIHILPFFFLFCFNLIHFCNTTSIQKFNHSVVKNEFNNEFRKKNIKKIDFKRKLQDKKSSGRKLDIDGNIGNVDDLDFVPLKILIDTKELNDSCPKGLKGYLNNILLAMQNAQKFLEGLLNIGVDDTADPDYFEGGYDTFRNKFGISFINPFFKTDFRLTDSYNYFIFGKFIETDGTDELNGDTSSLILDGFTGVPCTGIIFFNRNIAPSKLSYEYLKPLMLHHFIRVLGFNEQIIKPTSGNYILNSGTYGTVIEFANKYFGCSIESIVLTEEDDGYYEGSDEYLTALYWPKALFSGELLTKFDISEENYLSGFTKAFLNDLPYIRFKNGYTEDLTYFGRNKGCQCDCTYFTTGVYDEHFWNCDECRTGFFRATESSESETYCENNDNKDNYFLYNAESQIYKKCESAIANCQKCSSQTKCTLCKRGYELDDENGSVICEKEDDGLSTGAIIGIVFGCIGFLAIVALIIICLLKRRNKENEGEIEQKDEDVNEKKDEETEPKNVQDLKEGNVKILEYSKNSEIIDSGAEVKKDNA